MPAQPPVTANILASPTALLRRLEWRVRHAMENVLGGEYRSTFRGRGMEFDQVVKYEFGDDVRDIDWNVTARLGEPYRKKFVEEREITVLVVIDDTLSLQFGSGTTTKREALLELAALVMLLGAVNRDRVGFVYATPTAVEFREPQRGRNSILHAATALLSRPAPTLAPLPAGHTPASIPWKLISRAVPKHSILVWLGDFAPAPDPEGWPLLRRRYQTMGFRIDDPWERELPATGTLTAYDPATAQLVNLDLNASTRQAHAAWRAAREEAFTQRFPAPNSRLILTPAEDRLDALVRHFHQRASR